MLSDDIKPTFKKFSLLTFITISIFCYLHIQDARILTKTLMHSHVTSQAKILANGSLDDLLSKDYGELEQWVVSTAMAAEYAYAFIMSTDGKIIVHSDLSQVGKKQSPPNIKDASFKETLHNKKSVTEVIQPIYLEKKLLGTAHVAYLTNHSDENIKEHLLTILFWYILIGLILITGAYFLLKYRR